jgi:hypothetical protein
VLGSLGSLMRCSPGDPGGEEVEVLLDRGDRPGELDIALDGLWDRSPWPETRGPTLTPLLGPAGGGPYPALPPFPPPGWWARPWCLPGEVGRGPSQRSLRVPDVCPAADMARLAAVLWSLCVTAVLVTSATQGRCCGVQGGPTCAGAGWGDGGSPKLLVRSHSPTRPRWELDQARGRLVGNICTPEKLRGPQILPVPQPGQGNTGCPTRAP